jgi:hypothetical protein
MQSYRNVTLKNFPVAWGYWLSVCNKRANGTNTELVNNEIYTRKIHVDRQLESIPLYTIDWFIVSQLDQRNAIDSTC